METTVPIMRTVFFLLPMLLTGCIGIERADSPRPSLPAVADCTPDAQGMPRRMAVNDACLMKVRARDWLTPIPVAVSTGEVYRISSGAGQEWFDLNHGSHPMVGADGTDFMNLFAWSKRHPTSRWFALMATLVPDGQTMPPLPAHDLTRSALYRPPAAGRLALYPNDASLHLFGRPVFYLNNHGAIWALIERCDAACNPPGTQ